MSPRRQSVAIAADVRIKPLRASRSPPSVHVMPCRQPAMGARETGCFAHGRCGCVRVGWLSYLHHERQRPKRLCYLPTHAARAAHVEVGCTVPFFHTGGGCLRRVELSAVNHWHCTGVCVVPRWDSRTPRSSRLSTEGLLPPGKQVRRAALVLGHAAWKPRHLVRCGSSWPDGSVPAARPSAAGAKPQLPGPLAEGAGVCCSRVLVGGKAVCFLDGNVLGVGLLCGCAGDHHPDRRRARSRPLPPPPPPPPPPW